MSADQEIMRLLREAAREVESEIPPSVQPVIARARRRRLIRGSGSAVVALGTALVMVWSLMALARGLGGGTEPRRPGSEGLSQAHTLILSDITVRYPFSAAPEGETVAKDDPSRDPSMANVFFTATWSDDRWPGDVWCTFEAVAATGEVVGRERVLVGAPIVGRTAHFPGFGMKVSAEPVSVTGTCEDTEYVYPDGPGYVFEGVRVVGRDAESAEVVATARWASPIDPGPRVCSVEIATVDGGATTVGEVTLQGPDGHRADFGVPMPADRIASARITCRPLPGLLP